MRDSFFWKDLLYILIIVMTRMRMRERSLRVRQPSFILKGEN